LPLKVADALVRAAGLDQLHRRRILRRSRRRQLRVA
jgi:hypothetical protein